jgi:hypothetical protein
MRVWLAMKSGPRCVIVASAYVLARRAEDTDEQLDRQANKRAAHQRHTTGP